MLRRPLATIVSALSALLALVPVGPVEAREDDKRAKDEPTPLEVFQRSEDRLFRLGYRLATANAPFCNGTTLVSGLLIHDAESYGDPAAVRAQFRLQGDIGVQAVAPQSPAARAGIRQNDTILDIDGKAIATHWLATDPRWQRASSLRDTIDAVLASDTLRISWQGYGEPPSSAEIVGVPACPTRFELIASKSNAAADGNRVLVGERFPGLGYEEAVFAAAIAHEMAHNLLRHPQTFREIGWKRSLVRLSERDADRLMPWLLHNAGYDPRAAVLFMRRWGPKHGGWIFRKRTHDGWDERVEFIESELPKIDEAARARSDGLADWSTNFASELASHLPKG